MAQTQEARRSLRVKIKDGTMRVHHPVMPALTCTLLDISEGGVRCRMDTAALDDFAATAWRQLLGSGKLINVEILAPGLTQRCMIYAGVRHIRLGDNNAMEFGLKFHKPDSMQTDQISRAMHSYTRRSDRHTFEPEAAAAEPKDAARSATITVRRSESTRRMSAIPSASVQHKPKSLAEAARRLIKGLLNPRPKVVSYRGMKIGEILMRTGRITPKQAVEAYDKSRLSGIKYGRYLVRKQLITPVELSRALSLQTGLPIVDLANVALPETVKSAFPLDILKEHGFVPFNQFGSELYIAVVKPLSKEMLKTLEHECGLTLKVFLAYDEVIEAMLSSTFFEPAEPNA